MWKRFRRQNHPPRPSQPQHQSQQQLNEPIVDQKIHPNLNALEEQEDLRMYAPPAPTPVLPYIQYQDESMSPPLRPLSPRIRNLNLCKSEPRARSSPATTHHSDVIWPTFGRNSLRPIPQLRLSPPAQSHSSRKSTSTKSRRTSQTRSERSRTSSRPRTPHSTATAYHSITSRGPDSPHTFGRPSTPNRDISDNTSFLLTYGTPPPPLPPLDHPAFRFRDSRIPASNNSHNHEYEHSTKDRTIHSPRHSQSLSTLRSHSSVIIAKERRRRTSIEPRSRFIEHFSQSSFHSKQQQHYRHEKSSSIHGNHHSRKRSRSSISSRESRRSSAEYSAKRASSVAYGSEHDDNWEVQVAREILRLSFATTTTTSKKEPSSRRSLGAASSSIHTTFGRDIKARGDNVGQSSVDEEHHSGFPFLLQDTHNSYISDTLPSDTSVARVTDEHRHSHRKKYTICENMSQDDPQTPPPAKDKGKRKEGEVAPTHGSTSRRSKHSSISTPTRSRTPPPPQLRPIPDFGPTSLIAPSLQVTSPTPVDTIPSPLAHEQSTPRRKYNKSSPTEPQSSVLRHASPPPIQKSHSIGSVAKRKADEVEGGTPPKEQKATFAIGPRPHRASGTSSTSNAPSSFHRTKRARLSTMPESSSRPGSRDGSTSVTGDSPNAKNTGTWSSKNSKNSANHHTGSVRAPSTSSRQAQREPSRRSLSQASIPISALVSPHAPSVSRSSTFHMRDPRKPGRIQTTPWSLSFPARVETDGERWASRGWIERGGSPLHAWLFFIGFVIFPVWWAAAVIRIPKTRRLGETEAEKGVILDDPQVEHDARSWRTRCRIMAAVSFVTYVPFIVLVAIFARK